MRNPNPLETERELKTSLLGINGTDPFFRNNSAPRRAMNATQIGQALVIEGTKPRNIFTGLEKRFGEDTFNCSFPCDATVIEVIRRYTPGIGEDSIRENPETTIIYEDYNDPYKTVSVLQLKKYESFHTEFGYPLKPNPHTLERLSPGANFAKGEVLADSIAVGDDGNYSVGTKAQVCFMAHPGTIEDGFVVRKGFLKELTAHRYQTVVGSFGSKYFPLNLFGDKDRFKAFPDIGDVVGEDGILMAFREVDPELGVADMTPRALREVNHDFDRVLWAKPGARVIDVKIFHDERLNPSPTPTGMDEQARKYYSAQSVYYRRLLDVYERLKRQRKGALRISPEFSQLLVEALTYLPVAAHDRKLTKMYKLETLDEWRVEITYDWPIEVGQGMKASDFGGGDLNRKY